MDASVPIFRQTLVPLGLDVPPAGETDFESLVMNASSLSFTISTAITMLPNTSSTEWAFAVIMTLKDFLKYS